MGENEPHATSTSGVLLSSIEIKESWSPSRLRTIYEIGYAPHLGGCLVGSAVEKRTRRQTHRLHWRPWLLLPELRYPDQK